MIKKEELVKILWEEFLPQINSKNPVYFSFSTDLLNNVFSKHNIETKNSAKEINIACSDLIKIGKRHIHLNDICFEPAFNNFSYTILLVCQQVLVVEQMVRDKNGFSEDSYFPRLRKAISNELPELKSNPFKNQIEFISVWEKFREEVLLAGGTENTITFRPQSSRKNKTRWYPLSQALLSQEDIITLIKRIGKDALFKLDKSKLIERFRKEKQHLSKRSRDLLKFPTLYDRIINQIRTFENITFQNETSQEKINKDTSKKYDIKVFKDSIDIFDEEFVIGLFERETGNCIEDIESTHKELNDLIYEKKYIALINDNVAENNFWTTTPSKIELSKSDSLILISRKNEKPEITNVIKDLFPDATYEWEDLSDFSDLLICEISINMPPNKIIILKDLTLSVTSGIESIVRPEWVGGLCINQRSQKYLKDYLPTGIKYGDKQYELAGQVIINSRITTYEEFFSSIKELSSDESYSIEFEKGKPISLSLAVNKGNQDHKIGYGVSKNGLISPSASTNPLESNCLTGYQVDSLKNLKKLSSRQLALLINGNKSSWVPIDTKTLTELVEIVDSSLSISPIKDLILYNLQTIKKAPSEIINDEILPSCN